MERIRCEYEGQQGESKNFGHAGHGFIEFFDGTVSLVSLTPSTHKAIGCIDIPATCCSTVCCWGCAGAIGYILFTLLFLYVLPKTRTAIPLALVSNVESEGERASFTAQHPRARETQVISLKFRTHADMQRAVSLLSKLQ